MPRQSLFQLMELLLRGGIPVLGQQPFEVSDHGSERAVRVIGGTAILHLRMRFLRHLVFQGLDQP